MHSNTVVTAEIVYKVYADVAYFGHGPSVENVEPV